MHLHRPGRHAEQVGDLGPGAGERLHGDRVELDGGPVGQAHADQAVVGGQDLLDPALDHRLAASP